MMYHLPEKEFQDNLTEWCAGGPKKDGWTRRGFRVMLPSVMLTGCKLEDVEIEDVLAKNRSEINRWHLHYLRYCRIGESFNWKNTNYYWEYLKPRHEGRERALHFLELFDDIEENGLHRPVWVADVNDLDLGFQYFRFNGCHRACCMKILGYKFIPALVFKTRRT